MDEKFAGCEPTKVQERGPWLELESGTRFHILDPKPQDIFINDIAGALSKVCRFGGHTKEFYSVAEHCLNASVMAMKAYGGMAPDLWLAALMHDASEAYLVDIPRPVKMIMPIYKRMERDISEVIYRKYGVSMAVFADEVKLIDNRMLVTEQQQLMPPGPPYGDYEPFDIELLCLPPDVARYRFLKRFDECLNDSPAPQKSG